MKQPTISAAAGKSARFADRVAPKQQSNWDWRAAANFICGGAGGGLLFFAGVAALSAPLSAVALIVGMVLVATGLTCVWFEIGRPWRALNVFRHLATSWMTREASVAPLLFLLGALAVWTRVWPAALAAGLAGLAFLYSQARILQADKGIPAWRHARTRPLLVATGLAEGAGLLALVGGAGIAMAAVLILTLLARFLMWKSYLAALTADGAPAKALAALRGADRRLVWLGHALPAAAVLAYLSLGGSVFLWLAGAAAALSGGWMKWVLIRRAAFTQGFALPVQPVRGRGVSGKAVKPGWA